MERSTNQWAGRDRCWMTITYLRVFSIGWEKMVGLGYFIDPITLLSPDSHILGWRASLR